MGHVSQEDVNLVLVFQHSDTCFSSRVWAIGETNDERPGESSPKGVHRTLVCVCICAVCVHVCVRKGRENCIEQSDLFIARKVNVVRGGASARFVIGACVCVFFYFILFSRIVF